MSKPVKAVILTVVIAIAVVVLFLYVFPWVEQQQQDPTLGAPPAPIGAVATTQLVRSPR
jgi:flagellar basal body-associated protein FliL